MALHYGADDFEGGREQLARTLERERAKDTTLDYAQGFAERRGIVSARKGIEVPARARGSFAKLRLGREAVDHRSDAPAKGRFAGLKLSGRREKLETPARTTGDRLEQAVSGYADAWRGARRHGHTD